jgi:hypothetical protein
VLVSMGSIDMNGYWFTSSLIQIEPGEDAEINPGCYGRQLAIWLKTQLEHRSYSVEPIINEDWGRCLMCSRDPFMLWVGCRNVVDPERSGTAHPEKSLVWHCFVVAEVPWWRRLLPFSRPDTAAAVSQLDETLEVILTGTPEINIVDEP